jgi:hypothetical protein
MSVRIPSKILLLIVAACSTGPSPAGSTICIEIQPTTTDTQCLIDSDCVYVPTGRLCSAPCLGCGPGVGVNKVSVAAQLATKASSLPPSTACGPCPLTSLLECVEGYCSPRAH